MSTTTFRTATGYWLTAEGGGGGAVNFTRSDADVARFGKSWQTFDVVPQPDGAIVLRAPSGHYVTVEGGGGPGALLTATRTQADVDRFGLAWQRLHVLPQPNGSIVLRTETGYYVTAEAGGGGLAVADRNQAAVDQYGLGWQSLQAPELGASGVPTTPGQHAGISGRLRRDGRFYVNDGGMYRPVWASALYALAPGKPMLPFLDAVAGLGFGGVRTFCGQLEQVGQTAERARASLPALLDATQARGVYLEATLCTNTTGWSKDRIREHVRACAEIIGPYEHVIVEIGNELRHESQSDDLADVQFLRELRGYFPFDRLVAYGASDNDESTEFGDSDYVTIHLDRGRDTWNQVRRVKELMGVSEAVGKPFMNNEPIGAAEPGTPGQRWSDPAPFFGLGALNRLFDGGGIFHFQDGLDVHVPIGARQIACAQAFLRGWRAVHACVGDARLSYQNSNIHGGWSGSPAQSFDESRAVRTYAGVAGGVGAIVVVGGNECGLQVGAGWSVSDDIVDEYPGCRVVAVKK